MGDQIISTLTAAWMIKQSLVRELDTNEYHLSVQ